MSLLDLCIVSKELIPCVSELIIDQNTALPSNHAPVTACLTFPEERASLRQIATRSADIGCYPEKPLPLCKPPIGIHQIDTILFAQNMNSVEPMLAITGDHNTMANEFGELLYATITQSKALPPHSEPYDPATSRWKRIMDCGSHSTLWKAIDWSIQFCSRHR